MARTCVNHYSSPLILKQQSISREHSQLVKQNRQSVLHPRKAHWNGHNTPTNQGTILGHKHEKMEWHLEITKEKGEHTSAA
jgi:hypothetical protein